MRTLGFADVEVTPSGPDGGLDVVARDAAAQVKHYAASPVGAPAVQQLRGATPEGAWALFYALSGYTTAAVDFADRAKVALFRYDEDAIAIAVNDAASFLVRSQQTEATARPEAFSFEQDVKAVTQQYLDVSVKFFMSLANHGVEVAEVTGTFHPFVKAVLAEMSRVQEVLGGVDDRIVPISEAMSATQQINEATERLVAAMETLPEHLRI